MRSDLEALRLRMEAAAEAMDFEEASRLRDRISLLRGASPDAAPGEIDTARLKRHRPGAMGLGTSEQKTKTPAGWKRPPRPSPMTAGHKPAGGRRR